MTKSCITEDQKYQGALYRGKASKVDKRKSVSIAEPKSNRALVPRAAYVEDAPDADVPPPAPSPPPAVPAQPAQPVNVFDFLVAENSPNASRTSLSGSREQMSMKSGAHSIFSNHQNDKQVAQAGYKNGEELAYNGDYEEHGFTYGREPVKPTQYANSNGSLASLDFTTPAAKPGRPRIEYDNSAAHSRTNSGTTSDKKRKRGSPEALDLSAINSKGPRRRTRQDDMPMVDAPPSSADTPSLAHSGLTGGLNRLLSETRDPFPPTPDYSDEKEYAREMDRKKRYTQTEHPASPLKRSRHSKGDHSTTPGPGFSIKGRAGRIMSMVGGASTGGALSVLNPAGLQNKETALVKPRRRNSSSEDGHHGSKDARKLERRKYKVHKPVSMLSAAPRESSAHSQIHGEKQSSNASNTSRRRRASNENPDPQRRKVKAIEYQQQYHHQKSDHVSYSDSDDDSNHKTIRPRGGGGGAEMVVFGEEQRLKLRAESFLSYVTKGPDSEKGCSVNKALKRWHRDGAGTGAEHEGTKEEEQKELWRGLRLRKNDRGEIVVFF
jgi:cell growth-regulating nucleolar protein